jgi:hypothetical protein
MDRSGSRRAFESLQRDGLEHLARSCARVEPGGESVSF